MMLAILLLLATGAAASPPPPRSTVAPGLQRWPYLQSLGTDSVVVLWISNAPGKPGVDFGTVSGFERSAPARSEGNRRIATLRRLSPGTTYFYRIRAGERVLAAGPDLHFRTDPGRGDHDFGFFVTADVGYLRARQAVTSASILRAQPRPDLGIVAGDIVYDAGRSQDYDRNLMQPWREILCTIPVWPALGNHDWLSDPEKNWRREWCLPNNEHYYSFDYANAHFVALDTGIGSKIYDRKNQVAWLRADLEAHRDADWLFVYYHVPAITCTYHGDNKKLIKYFLPVFEEYGVDVVFSGHSHTYERLYPIRAGRPVDVEQEPHYKDPRGPIYIVSGAGAEPKIGSPTRRCGPTAYFRDETLLWTEVRITGMKCTIRAYASETHRLVDEVTIQKTRGREKPATH